LLSACLTTRAPAPSAIDSSALSTEAIELLRRYIRIDTTNPPGHETLGAEFLARILRREGVPVEVIELEPGRGNVVARLKGDGSRKALVLLNHIDVVPAERRSWTVDPFGGEVKSYYVVGRGALDMKGPAIVQLMTMLVLARHRTALKSDVVFLATADEESGGSVGIERLLESRPELVRDVETVLTEGGHIHVPTAGPAVYSVGVGEKIPAWIRLTASGKSGHASAPRPDDAPRQLLLAVARLLQHEFPVHVLPEVRQYLAAIAPTEKPPWNDRLRDITQALEDKDVRLEFARTLPWLSALTRTTLAVTVLEGSPKTNVIPERARAEIDLRFLPGTDPSRALAEIRRIIDDEGIVLEPIVRPIEAGSSPVAHRFFDVIRAVAESTDPGAQVVAAVRSPFTDCRHFRGRKVPCYGFTGFRFADDDESGGVHGDDEQMSIASLAHALKTLHEIVRRMAAD
jgi:acetylornithine deacetylase/succinyl-diaminopimelate desuccinylase-like protein